MIIDWHFFGRDTAQSIRAVPLRDPSEPPHQQQEGRAGAGVTPADLLKPAASLAQL